MSESPRVSHPTSLDSVAINDAPASSDSGESLTKWQAFKAGLAVYWSVVKKVSVLLPFCLAIAIAGNFVGPLQNGLRVKFYAPADVYNATNGCNGRSSPIQPLPQACLDAQNTNERVSGILTAAGAVTQFFLLPVLGKASDAYGRRPLAIFSCVCMLIDAGTLLFTQLTGASLYFYFVAEFIGAFAAFNVVFLSVMADKTTNEERGIAFAVIFGLLGLTALVALSVVASIGDTISQNLLILIATSATVAQLLWAIFLVPETCPVETRRPFAWQPADLNPARSLGVFRTSSAMRWLAIAFALQSFAIQGTGSIGQTFVVNKFSLTVAEQSTIGIIVQVSGIVIQMIVLPTLLVLFSDKIVFLIAAAAVGTCYILTPTVPSISIQFVLVGVGSLAGTLFPLLSLNMSKRVPRSQQGSLDAATMAINTLAGAPADLIFAAWLYSVSRPLGFIVGTVILGLAALSALRVRPQTPEEEAAVKAASSIEEVSESEGVDGSVNGSASAEREGVPTAGGEYSYRSMSDDKL